MRLYYFQTCKETPSGKAVCQWFLNTYGQALAPSQITKWTKPEFAYLDDESIEVDGERMRREKLIILNLKQLSLPGNSVCR